jgi:hypothetical protein
MKGCIIGSIIDRIVDLLRTYLYYYTVRVMVGRIETGSIYVQMLPVGGCGTCFGYFLF